MEVRNCEEIAEMLKSRPEVENIDNSSESEDNEECMSESESEFSDVHSEYRASAEERSSDETEVEAEVPPRKKCKIDKPAKFLSKTLYGKNRYKWTTMAPESRGRRSKERLITYLPAGKGIAAQVGTAMEAWSLLMPEELLNIIVTHTNTEIARRRENRKEQTFTHDLDLIEMKAFLGLLYFSGVHDNGYNYTARLWGALGSTVYRATMPRNRFVFLLETLRFDDKNTRVERKKTDKLAPIREIWELMLTMCKQYYTPHKYCTIDEQLLSFRGRCPFRIDMPAKPDKYGMKIIMLNDARTSYMVNAIPYVGVVTNKEHNESLPSYYVRTLSEPIHGSARNITCDNWFTSIPMVDRMLKSYSLI